MAARAPSLAVVMVSDDTIDDATAQFLLSQTLLAIQQEEEAREQAEVQRLEDVVTCDPDPKSKRWPWSRHNIRSQCFCGRLVLGQGAKLLSGSTQGICPPHRGS